MFSCHFGLKQLHSTKTFIVLKLFLDPRWASCSLAVWTHGGRPFANRHLANRTWFTERPLLIVAWPKMASSWDLSITRYVAGSCQQQCYGFTSSLWRLGSSGYINFWNYAETTFPRLCCTAYQDLTPSSVPTCSFGPGEPSEFWLIHQTIGLYILEQLRNYFVWTRYPSSVLPLLIGPGTPRRPYHLGLGIPSVPVIVAVCSCLIQNGVVFRIWQCRIPRRTVAGGLAWHPVHVVVGCPDLRGQGMRQNCLRVLVSLLSNVIWTNFVWKACFLLSRQRYTKNLLRLLFLRGRCL